MKLTTRPTAACCCTVKDMTDIADCCVELGALTRISRQQQNISMSDLADRAQVSRSTIHRLENGTGIRPQPQRLARILNTLGISLNQVTAILPNTQDTWSRQLLTWMARLNTDAVKNFLDNQRDPSGFDLLAVRSDTVAAIQIRTSTDDAAALIDELQSNGWLISRPVIP